MLLIMSNLSIPVLPGISGALVILEKIKYYLLTKSEVITGKSQTEALMY